MEKFRNKQGKFTKGGSSWNKGIPCKESTKDKLRKINLGKKLSEETKRLIKLNNAKYWKNRQKSTEHLRRIGEGLKGKKHSEAVKIKLSESHKGDKNPNWKGDNVGYSSLHAWTRRELKFPKICSICGKTNCRIDVANIDHKYRRNIDDFTPMCISCHRKHDIKKNLISLPVHKFPKGHIPWNKKTPP